jgi:hypothetical protein
VTSPGPLLSLVVPCWRSDPAQLDALLAGLAPRAAELEVVWVNDDPGNAALAARLVAAAARLPHARLVAHAENAGIFAAYRSGFAAATAPFAAILDHDDVVDPAPALDALRADPGVDLLYTDEYKLGPDGPEQPFRKPEWDPLSAVFYFYAHHLACWRTAVVQAALADEPAPRYATIFDLWLAAAYQRRLRRPLRARHLDAAAYGWRIHAGSSSGDIAAKPSNGAERIRLAAEHLGRLGEPALLALDAERRWLVRGWFHSANEVAGLPPLARRLAAGEPLRATPGSAVSFVGAPSPRARLAALDRLYRIPLRYLAALGYNAVLVPTAAGARLAAPLRPERHPPDVPCAAGCDVARFQADGGSGALVALAPGSPRRQVAAVVLSP